MCPDETVSDCLILLQNYVIDVYLGTDSISAIVGWKAPSPLCVQSSKMKIDAVVVHSLWVPQAQILTGQFNASEAPL